MLFESLNKFDSILGRALGHYFEVVYEIRVEVPALLNLVKGVGNVSLKIPFLHKNRLDLLDA